MRRKHVLGKYSGLYIGMFPDKIIGNQPELFEGGFEDKSPRRFGEVLSDEFWVLSCLAHYKMWETD